MVTSIILLSSGHAFADRSSAPCSVGCTNKIVNLAVSQIPAGPQGVPGAVGPQGTPGADGQGVPAGGVEGQVLLKGDSETEWEYLAPPINEDLSTFSIVGSNSSFDGCSNLEVEKTDAVVTKWANTSPTLNTMLSSTDGFSNTMTYLRANALLTNTAFGHCETLNNDEPSAGWYLPASDELWCLAETGVLGQNLYWSSTLEADWNGDGEVDIVTFDNKTTALPKRTSTTIAPIDSTTPRVRCVRRLPSQPQRVT